MRKFYIPIYLVLGLWIGPFLPRLMAQLELQEPMKPEKMKKTFIFSLLPKAFQDKPLLGVSVITEMTEEGKKIKPPTPTNPAYYQISDSGYHHEGGGVRQDGERDINRESLKQEVQKSLAAANYREETTEHSASLLLLYVWGVHAKLYDLNHRNTLSRATLVGGQKFAEELAAAIEAQEDNSGRGRHHGIDLFNPVYQFSVRNDKNRVLMDQVLDDCYYVVVSAYDKAAYEKGERKLLWRTKMSTAASGVSLAETSTALISSGTPYFGRWMTEASIIDKKISRKGKVELGETRIVSMDEPADAAPDKPKTVSTGKK